EKVFLIPDTLTMTQQHQSFHARSFSKGNRQSEKLQCQRRVCSDRCGGKQMSEHKATIQWTRTGDEFLKGKYSRAPAWTVDGGVTIAASSSPAAVPLPFSVPENVDPEEAFVASVSSCHMMTYLWVAFRNGYVIDSYIDEAVGVM